MKKTIFLIISATYLTACGALTPDPVYVDRLIVPDVAPVLRKPCAAPTLPGRGEALSEIGVLLIGYDASLSCANGKIIATDAILTDAEDRVRNQPE